MTGTLGLFSLVDLFQLLSSANRTGRLVVDHPEGDARLYFRQGRVVHAEFCGLTGEEAVFALFADEQGTFEFTTGLPAPEESVTAGTENLILEAIRRVDEARRDRPEEIPAEAVPAFAEGPGAGNLVLDTTEVGLLRFVDGQRTVRELAELAGVGTGEVQGKVRRLLEMGVLRVTDRRPRTARLVTQLTTGGLGPAVAGVDPNILDSWRRALGYDPGAVACRRPDGRVDTFQVSPVEQAGPYILFTRDTLIRADLAANVPLLVRPVPRREA